MSAAFRLPLASGILLALLGLADSVPLLAQEDPSAKVLAPPDTHAAVIVGNHIATRDGTTLYATVYKPREQEKPLPAIFTFTPYNTDTYNDRGNYFARHGYVFVIADVRGRGNSGGDFEPGAHEAKDGFDVVEWIAKQPWCNGKVAMWGGSYAGMDQWLAASQLPPHLMTIVPVASAHFGVDVPAFNNIFAPYAIQWATYTTEKTAQRNLWGDDNIWIGTFRKLYLNHDPFRYLDRLAGNTETVFQKWLQHPMSDGYWDSLGVSEEQYRKIDIPILSITGDYDADQLGAMTYYRDFMRVASDQQRARSYLIIGPWDHPGTRTPRADFGGLHFGPASLLDMNDLHRQWYDWTMKDGKKPKFLKKPIAYYVTGLEQWRYAGTLSVVGSDRERFYLSSAVSANDAFHAGYLLPKQIRGRASDRYVYDPLDVRPEQLERRSIPNYITDDRYALNLFGNGLVYYTEPFREDRIIAGNVALNVWMSMDVPDTDFSASLNEILPDGRSISLTGDAMRARYRDSLREQHLVPLGEIVEYRFRTFTFFARRIQKGSRLRLIINSPNSIYAQKNYNSGGVVAEETAKDARTAHITLYHDAAHPSYLEVPFDK